MSQSAINTAQQIAISYLLQQVQLLCHRSDTPSCMEDSFIASVAALDIPEHERKSVINALEAISSSASRLSKINHDKLASTLGAT